MEFLPLSTWGFLIQNHTSRWGVFNHLYQTTSMGQNNQTGSSPSGQKGFIQWVGFCGYGFFVSLQAIKVFSLFCFPGFSSWPFFSSSFYSLFPIAFFSFLSFSFTSEQRRTGNSDCINSCLVSRIRASTGKKENSTSLKSRAILHLANYNPPPKPSVQEGHGPRGIMLFLS